MRTHREAVGDNNIIDIDLPEESWIVTTEKNEWEIA